MLNQPQSRPPYTRKLPKLSEDHMCFGAGPANPHGLRMEFFTDEERIYSRLTVPEFMNSWQGIVHGGIVTSILDETMFYAALCFFKCIALTKEITVRLFRPARFDQMPFDVVGEIKEREGDTFAVISGKIFNSQGKLCAESTGRFGLVKSHIIKKLGILTDKDIRMIQELIEKM